MVTKKLTNKKLLIIKSLVFILVIAYLYSPLTDDYIKQPGRMNTRLYATILLLSFLAVLVILKLWELKGKQRKGESSETSTIKKPGKRK